MQIYYIFVYRLVLEVHCFVLHKSSTIPDSHTISSLEWETKKFPEVNHARLTCEVQTLLKVTNMKVCTKQQKVMSLYSHSDATVSSRS